MLIWTPGGPSLQIHIQQYQRAMAFSKLHFWMCIIGYELQLCCVFEQPPSLRVLWWARIALVLQPISLSGMRSEPNAYFPNPWTLKHVRMIMYLAIRPRVYQPHTKFSASLRFWTIGVATWYFVDMYLGTCMWSGTYKHHSFAFLWKSLWEFRMQARCSPGTCSVLFTDHVLRLARWLDFV